MLVGGQGRDYFRCAFVCEEQMPMIEPCAGKLLGFIAHIGDLGIEDNVSVRMLADYGEGLAAPINKGGVAASFATEILLCEATLCEHQWDFTVGNNSARGIPCFGESQLGGENDFFGAEGAVLLFRDGV